MSGGIEIVNNSAFMQEETKQEKLQRYLNYECTYKYCKYKGKTWQQIINDDYPHFFQLMSDHVPADSQTFEVLSSQLMPTDIEHAKNSTRFVDTPVYKQQQLQKYMNMTCSHKGRMANKTWGEIYQKDYNYYLWAVGNTMGRHTRSYQVFLSALTKEDQEYVNNTPKGKVSSKNKPQKNISSQR